jgi:pimeloyl-ACP methyl ester carboxylesterase
VTRLVLVHGSVANAAMTFAQQQSLADRFELVLHTRSGYPPRPPLPAIDFEEQAAELAGELRPGDHVVGHSYGAVVSLLAAATRDNLGSLTVGEPPAFGIGSDDPAVREFMGTYAAFSTTDPKEYIDFFLPLVGSRMPPATELSPELEQGTRAAMAERPPNEAEIPLGTLRAMPYPKLVISGGHSAAFDAVCDVLERELAAERAVVPGAGHSLPRAPGYNDVLVDFVERSS